MSETWLMWALMGLKSAGDKMKGVKLVVTADTRTCASESPTSFIATDGHQLWQQNYNIDPYHNKYFVFVEAYTKLLMAKSLCIYRLHSYTEVGLVIIWRKEISWTRRSVRIVELINKQLVDDRRLLILDCYSLHVSCFILRGPRTAFRSVDLSGSECGRR